MSSWPTAGGSVEPLRKCKNYSDCGGDAADAPSRGCYAGLCVACRREAATARSTRARGEVVIDGKLEDAVKAMVPIARRLERAAGAFTMAKEERRGAANEFNSAIRALAEVAQRVFNSSRVATARIDERLERASADADTPGA